MDWIDLDHDWDQWRDFVMNIPVPQKMLGNSWIAAQLAASQEGSSCIVLVRLTYKEEMNSY
jgi:hypothetical protein